MRSRATGVSLLTLSTVTVTVDTMTTTDWHSMQERAERDLQKAKDRRDEAEYAYQLQERKVEFIKRARRAAEGV